LIIYKVVKENQFMVLAAGIQKIKDPQVVMGPGWVKFLLLGFGQVSHLWVGFGKFPLKSQIFQLFALQVKK